MYSLHMNCWVNFKVGDKKYLPLDWKHMPEKGKEAPPVHAVTPLSREFIARVDGIVVVDGFWPENRLNLLKKLSIPTVLTWSSSETKEPWVGVRQSIQKSAAS